MDIEEEQKPRLSRSEISHLFSHCEYLTRVRIFNQYEAKRYLLIDTNLTEITTEELKYLTVELFYFSFACKLKNVYPSLHEETIVYDKEDCQVVCMTEAIFTNKNRFLEQDKIYFRFFQALLKQIVKISHEKESSEREKMGLGSMETMPSEKSIGCGQDLDRLLQNCKQTEGVKESDLACFTEIQKCDIVRSRSVVYRMRNLSLLFRLTLDEMMKKEFLKFTKEERDLISQYHETKLIHKKCHQQLLEIEQKIQNNMKAYFATFHKSFSISYLEEPIYSLPVGCSMKEIMEKERLEMREKNKIKFRIKVEAINQDPFWEKPTKKQDDFLLFLVQYNTRNQKITVRLETPIPLSNDCVCQQFGEMCFSSFSFLLESSEQEQKYVVIKAVSEISVCKSDLIPKILKTIESTTAFYMSMQSALVRKAGSSTQVQDISENIVKISAKISHYIRFSNDCSQKIYNKLISEK